MQVTISDSGHCDYDGVQFLEIIYTSPLDIFDIAVNKGQNDKSETQYKQTGSETILLEKTFDCEFGTESIIFDSKNLQQSGYSEPIKTTDLDHKDNHTEYSEVD